ncbi:MAG: FHA domain-containing protein [Gemmatimonadetes bacterium]|nr:FHA domain-containing protein [Gemmatimonadota bacterium]
MDALTIVEVRDGKGVLTARVRVGAQTVRVGRAPDNDVVVEDEFVDAHHLEARLVQDGVWIRDLGSRNGTRVGGEDAGGVEVHAPFGAAVELGQTRLLFRAPHADVPETRALPVEEPRLFPYERWPAWPLWTCATLLITAGAWIAGYDRFGPAIAVGVLLAVGVLILLWVGLWAAGTRLLTGRSRFREHLAFSSVFTLVFLILDTPLGWLRFAVGSPLLDAGVGLGINSFLLWSVGIFGHVDIASRRSRAFKVGVATTAGVLAVLMSLAFQRADLGPSFDVQRGLSTLAPVPPSLTRTTSVEAFFADLEDLQAGVEEEAEEARREREDDASEDAGAEGAAGTRASGPAGP